MAQLKYEQIKEWLQEEALKPSARKKMPTVREIQQRFKVSQAPVSRALQELESKGVIRRKQGSGITAVISDSKQISHSTKKSNGTIFFAYPMYQSELKREMIHFFEQSALQKKIRLCHYGMSQGDSFDGLLKAASTCKDLRGIIITTMANRLPFDVISSLGKLKVPVVITDNLFQYELPGNIFSLSADMYDRGYCTAKYLLEKGHISIGLIRNEPIDDVFKQYQKGVKKAIKEFGNGMKYFFFATTIKSWEDSVEAAQKITTLHLDDIRREKITALAYYSTAGAFAAIQTVCEAGFKVPEEISIIGGAEYWYGKYANPALTCMTCDYFQMIRDTYAIVSGEIKEFPQEKRYKAKIVERNSVIKRDHK